MRIVILILSILLSASLAHAGELKTYLKYPPSQELPAGSMWNPYVTVKDGKKVKETYYRYPASEILKLGTIWNPWITEQKGECKRR